MGSMSAADRPHTYADLRKWAEDTRWEIIDGQAHAMTGPSWQHQAVTMGLAAQLWPTFERMAAESCPRLSM